MPKGPSVPIRKLSISFGLFGQSAIQTRNNPINIFRALALVGVLAAAGLMLPSTPAHAACAAPQTDLGVASSTVSVPTTGTYRAWSRIMAPDTANKSYLLEVDGGNCYLVGGGTLAAGSWSWIDYQDSNTASAIDIPLTAGTHALKFIGNAPGVRLDRLIMTTDTSCTPTGTGDNCVVAAATATPTVVITLAPTSEPSNSPSPAPTPTPPVTTGPGTHLHYTGNSNFASSGAFAPGAYGFNVADVGSVSDLNSLPSGDKGLAWIGMCNGTDAAFQSAVIPYMGNSKLFGFYLMDEPDPTGQYNTLCPPASLKAESDWIHANVPGAKTFIIEMVLSASSSPSYAGDYTPANSNIDLYGLDPYPCRTELGNSCDYTWITKAVTAAKAEGIPEADIVPVYQAFGGGAWVDDGGGSYLMPSASQETQILSTWAAAVPTPVFDYAYSWGSQNSDTSLSSDGALQQIFAAHNSGSAPTPTPSPSPTPTATPSPTDSPSPTDTATPAPTDTPTPTDQATPSPEPTPIPIQLPPTVSLTAPADGSQVSAVVSLSATASDEAGVTEVDFAVDGTTVNTSPTPPYAYDWDTTSFSNGTHSVTATAIDASGLSSTDTVSVDVENTPASPPAVPTNVQVTLGAFTDAGYQVNLTWEDTDAPLVSKYFVVRDGTTVAEVDSGTSYADTVDAGAAYSYQVIAQSAAGDASQLSDPASITVPAAPAPPAQNPPAPTGLAATLASSTQVNLSWSAGVGDDPSATYDIFRTSGGAPVIIATISGTSYGDTNLKASTTYTYYVVARDALGNLSEPSSTVKVTTPSSSPVSNYTGSIKGKIKDSSGHAIRGAHITLSFGGKMHTFTTTSNGSYLISGVPTGTYNVRYRANGYAARSKEILIKRHKTDTVNITLTRNKK